MPQDSFTSLLRSIPLRRIAGVLGVMAVYCAFTVLRVALLDENLSFLDATPALSIAFPSLLTGLVCVACWQRVHTFKLGMPYVLLWLVLSWIAFLVAVACFVLFSSAEELQVSLSERLDVSVPKLAVEGCLVVVVMVMRSICSGAFWAAKALSLGEIERQMARRLTPQNQVLYLRSFGHDTLGVEPRSGAPGVSLVDWFEHRRWLFEEVLGEGCGPDGVMVAMGFRARYAFPLGCVRRSVGRTIEWQDEVRREIRDSGVVILALGTTPGLVWEIGEVRRTLPMERVLVVNPRVFDRDSLKCWQQFHSWAKTEIELPSVSERPNIVGFERTSENEYRGVVIDRGTTDVGAFSKVLRRSVTERLHLASSLVSNQSAVTINRGVQFPQIPDRE